jgi:cell division protein FtsA
VVTGGTAIMEGVPELAEAVFDLPVRRGLPQTVGGLADVVNSPIFATGVGLAMFGARRQGPRGHSAVASGGGLFARMTRRLAGWLGEIL